MEFEQRIDQIRQFATATRMCGWEVYTDDRLFPTEPDRSESVYAEETMDCVTLKWQLSILIFHPVQLVTTVTSKTAKGRSELLYRAFSAHVRHLCRVDQILAIDETACNECNDNRKYGWSSIESIVELVYSMQRSEN